MTVAAIWLDGDEPPACGGDNQCCPAVLQGDPPVVLSEMLGPVLPSLAQDRTSTRLAALAGGTR